MTTALAHRSLRRMAFAAAGAVLVAAIVQQSAADGTEVRQIVVFATFPDVALFFGVGHGLAKGQLHPRAVRLYNLLHRVWGPVALAALAATGAIPHAFLVGALAWAAHIALDRTLGYGLRDRAGFQRS